jgi:hypothetical protein
MRSAMRYRTLLFSVVFASGMGLAGLAQADIVAVDSGIAIKESDGVAPPRGMTMSQVANKFGAPVTKVPAVGNPPISRWEYPGFVVYFERDYVIHSVVSESAAPAAEPTAERAPPAAPAAAAVPAPAAAPAPAEPAAATDSSPAPAAESAAPVEPPPAP